MTYILTRVQVGDYEAWKPIFDSDPPGARSAAKSHRLLRSLEDPNEVYVSVEFASPEDARAAREKLLASGILDRFPDHTGPTVAEVAEAVSY